MTHAPAQPAQRGPVFIPDRRQTSHHRGIKLIINHDHLAKVLRVKHVRDDYDAAEQIMRSLEKRDG